MRYAFTFVLAALIAPAASFGQALADRLPADAEIYAGWSGSDSIGPGYDQSHLKAVLDASQIGQFVHESIPRLIATIAQKDPESARQVRQALDLLSPLFVHPSAFYFGGLTPGGPLPKVALICDAGDDAPHIVTQVNQLLQQAQGNPFTCRTIGTLVVLSDFTLPDQIENPLSKDKDFLAVMGNLGKDPAAALYVNATAVTNTIGDAIQMYAPPPVRQNWLQVRNGLGLSGLKTIAATAGLDGKNWAVKADILAPARGMAWWRCGMPIRCRRICLSSFPCRQLLLEPSPRILISRSRRYSGFSSNLRLSSRRSFGKPWGRRTRCWVLISTRISSPRWGLSGDITSIRKSPETEFLARRSSIGPQCRPIGKIVRRT